MNPTKYTLAFDVYGTLIDTTNIFYSLEKLMGHKAAVFNESWRNKQLEYSFRRSAMQKYVPFSTVTQQALDFCCQKHKVELTDSQKVDLMNEYKVLPLFPECLDAINQLKTEGHRLFAFSNGSNNALFHLLSNAKILNLFEGFVSLEDIETFKPNPHGYAYFNHKTNSQKENTWMISGNSFDIIGAANYGMKTIWVHRSKENIFDAWEFEASMVVNDLKEISF